MGFISILGCLKFNRMKEIPACFFSVLAVLTKQYIQSALLASDVQIFDPLIKYSLPLSSAEVEIFARSDPAPGSENP